MKLLEILEAFEKVYVLLVEDKDNQFKQYNMKLLQENIEELRKLESHMH